MVRFSQFLLVAPLALFSAAAAAGPAEDGYTVVERWAAAFNANDADAVVKLYAPNGLFLGTSSPLLAEGTDAIRAYFSTRLPGTGNKVAIADHRVVVLDDNAVLVTGFYDFTVMQDGKPVPLPARFTMVVTKSGGDWSILHHHSSARPKPPQ